MGFLIPGLMADWDGYVSSISQSSTRAIAQLIIQSLHTTQTNRGRRGRRQGTKDRGNDRHSASCEWSPLSQL